jgi:hypothetical protein
MTYSMTCLVRPALSATSQPREGKALITAMLGQRVVHLPRTLQDTKRGVSTLLYVLTWSKKPIPVWMLMTWSTPTGTSRTRETLISVSFVFRESVDVRGTNAFLVAAFSPILAVLCFFSVSDGKSQVLVKYLSLSPIQIFE